MQKIKSRAARRRARKSGSDALSLSVTTTLLCAAGGLHGQTAATPAPGDPNKEGETGTLEEVVIEADANIYNPQRLQSPKQTQPLRDTPQTVTVIPKALIQERGAFSLRDVLRNTPGISMQAGEGVSGAGQGDNLAIRGFASRSDWFVDGMRDLGSYNRDPFNLEQVEVAKGPASTTSGRGSTGGSINLVTKMASKARSSLATTTVGTDNLFRVTADVNEPLGEHMAFRLNGMYHDADTPGRDRVEQERYGLAASLAFGLDTDTRLTFNYQRLEENNMPDFGIPWVPATGAFSGSGAALAGHGNQVPPGVSFDSFYGLTNVDFQRNQGDMFTAIFEHDFSDHLHLRNQTRYSRVHYHSVTTAPRFRDTSAAGGSQFTAVLGREAQRRQMTNEFFANQTLVTADFKTGALKHALVTGFEVFWERQLNAAAVGISSTTNIFNPDVSGGLVGPANPRDTTLDIPNLPGPAESHLDTVSAYLFDTVNIGPHVEITGGVRYDHLEIDARGTGSGDRFGGPARGATNSDDVFTWKAAVVYKPVEYGSIYAGWATSFNATGDGTLPAGLGLNNGSNQTTSRLDPEESRIFEAGTKWDLLSERLSLTAALFHTEKTNARTTFANVTTLSGDLEVQGVELGVAGRITKDWQIFAGFTHMDSEVKESTNPAEVGNPVPNTPENAFNLWTTYSLLPNLQVGFGAQYMGHIIGSAANPARVVPDYWVADAMVSYRINDKLSLQLNVYNFTNERYIETSGSTGHFIPGPGRSAALTASVKF